MISKIFSIHQSALERLYDRPAGRADRRGRRSLPIAVSLFLIVGGVTPADAGRQSGEMWRDLLRENSRAELDVGGPVVDFGTADQHKYTRGGWVTGWGDPARDDAAVSYAPVTTTKAAISAMTYEPTKELVMRLRSRAGDQRVKVYWDDARIGREEISSAWQVVRFPIPGAGSAPGRHQVRFEFGRARPHAADVDWMWLRTGDRAEPPGLSPRMSPLRIGGRVRRALLAPTARSLSFYLHVPRGGFLTFDYGADKRVRFAVRVQTVAGSARQLFRATAAPGAWKSARVDLRQFSGQAVRLEFATSGPPGRAGWGAPEIRVPRRSRRRGPVVGANQAKNVILVVYDTTRADLFRPFNSSTRVVAPSYDALASRSAAFVNAYNNESWTRPSTITILTGLYPDTHGALFARSVLDDEVEMLPEHLHKHGLRTHAIVGNPVLRAKFGLDQGWDEYRNHGRDDDSAARLYGDAAEWLAEHHDDGRFFLYVHSHDSHTPYAVDRDYSRLYYPDDYRGFVGSSLSNDEQRAIGKGKRRADKDDMAWIWALYNGEATYQDEHFGKMIAKLDELGIMDETMIVVTNDHGEEFREHGDMGHGWTLHEEQLRAPLLIHYPRLFTPGTKVSELVEQVDVVPTIVETLGLPPLADAEGQSLIPLVTGRGAPPKPNYVVAALRDEERAIRVGRWKLIVDHDKGWRNLYDLAADPGEKRDRSTNRPIAGRLCEIYLGEALATPTKARRLGAPSTRRRFHSRPAKLDARSRRELEALGYFGDVMFRQK